MNHIVKAKVHKKGKYNVFLIMVTIMIGFVVILGFVFIDNKNIEYEYFSVKSENTVLEEIKIAHLSDLHFPKIKIDIDKMVLKLKEENPDIIVITGDLIDRNAIFNACKVEDFVKKITQIAPIFYVNGNHEAQNTENAIKLYEFLENNSVIVLNNESVNVKVKNSTFTIIGLSDNADYNSNYFKDFEMLETKYKVLLAHRPEKWTSYTSKENDIRPHLILTGHAHGGQFRFFGQGLIAPNQGLLPKYDGGIYKTDDEKICMIVSRGIGNSLLPVRFNNNPHIPIITLSLSE